LCPPLRAPQPLPYTTLFRSVLVEDPESHARSSPALRRPAIEQALQHHPPLLRLRPEAPSGQSAVDHERVTVHEARLITGQPQRRDRKSTRLNSSHEWISYAV